MEEIALVTRKSSCVNARGIPPARGRKMLTPPPAAGPDPPHPRQLDLTPPATEPDPPRQLDLTPPPAAGPDPPPGSWTWPPPAAGPDPPPWSWTWPPPPRQLDLTPPPVDKLTKWNYYLPHPSDAGGNSTSSNSGSNNKTGIYRLKCRNTNSKLELKKTNFAATTHYSLSIYYVAQVVFTFGFSEGDYV